MDIPVEHAVLKRQIVGNMRVVQVHFAVDCGCHNLQSILIYERGYPSVINQPADKVAPYVTRPGAIAGAGLGWTWAYRVVDDSKLGLPEARRIVGIRQGNQFGIIVDSLHAIHLSALANPMRVWNITGTSHLSPLAVARLRHVHPSSPMRRKAGINACHLDWPKLRLD